MPTSSTHAAVPEDVIARSVDFEVTLADLVRRSERRAWRVAWSAIAMALILAGGYFILLPLKEKVPYLVMADAYTGTSTVARLTGDFGAAAITASEAINKSDVSHFVLARESYDYSQFGQRDWDTVHAMAAPGVGSEYARLFAKTNPANPQLLFGQGKSIRIRILSLQLHESPSTDAKAKSATVRFQRSVHDKASGTTQPLDSRIASVEFVYKSNLRMDESHRMLNPLGFQVTSYRVDNDYAAAPSIDVGIGQRPSPADGAAASPSPGEPRAPDDAGPSPSRTMQGRTVPVTPMPHSTPESP